jgi:hypothetical protein
MQASGISRNVDDEQRRLAGRTTDFHTHAGNRLLSAPARHELHGGLHISILFPLRIKIRRLVRNSDVRLEQIQN